MAVECEAALDADFEFVTQRDKIADRAQMDVWRLVPWMRQQVGYRHPAAQQQTEANFPESEIRKRDDRALADPHQRLDDSTRSARRLQGLAQHDNIERPHRIGIEVAIGIALDH